LRAVFFGRIKKQVRRPRFIKKGLRRRKKLWNASFCFWAASTWGRWLAQNSFFERSRKEFWPAFCRNLEKMLFLDMLNILHNRNGKDFCFQCWPLWIPLRTNHSIQGWSLLHKKLIVTNSCSSLQLV
jgi:hypothetical protein